MNIRFCGTHIMTQGEWGALEKSSPGQQLAKAGAVRAWDWNVPAQQISFSTGPGITDEDLRIMQVLGSKPGAKYIFDSTITSNGNTPEDEKAIQAHFARLNKQA